MRFFEMLLFAVMLSALIARLIPGFRQKPMVRYLSYAAGILIPVQLLIEGYRWQMVPVYVFTLGLIIVSLIAQRAENGRLIKHKAVGAICIVLSSLYILSFSLNIACFRRITQYIKRASVNRIGF